MNYVPSIEPRLTPHRPARPTTVEHTLQEWTKDLAEELSARLRLVSEADLHWQPHPDANSAGVTVWHVARWLDVLGTRLFTGASADREIWRSRGWQEDTGYRPEGIGHLGLGTLTGYSPDEMRAVPRLPAAALETYLGQSAAALIEQVPRIGSDAVTAPLPHGLSPYQLIGSTLQGSFGHVGEIDTLVNLRALWAPGTRPAGGG